MKNNSTNIFRKSRESTKEKVSMQRAAEKLFIDYKQLSRYETGETMPTPNMVLRMSKLYNDPALRRRYCTEVCDIGKQDQAFSNPHSLYSSGYKLIGAKDELEKIKNTLFQILADGVVDPTEMKVLNDVIPEQIKSVKKVLNEIEIEIEKKNFV